MSDDMGGGGVMGGGVSFTSLSKKILEKRIGVGKDFSQGGREVQRVLPPLSPLKSYTKMRL